MDTFRELPILFQGAMVRAIIDHRKTETRRLRGLDDVNDSPHEWTWDGEKFSAESETACTSWWPGECPYGNQGDALWVRETFAPWRYTSVEYADWDSLTTREERGGLSLSEWAEQYGHHDIKITYLADQKGKGEDTWMPSIHMPRWACRLLLNRTADTRYERLQAITEAGALAEGVVDWGPERRYRYSHLTPAAVGDRPVELFETAVEAFVKLWDSINAKRGFSFAFNPWVRVVSFEAK